MFQLLRFILIFSLLIGVQQTSFAYNRYFTWVDPKSCLRVRINLDNHFIYKEISPGDWKIDAKVAVNINDLKALTPSINNHYFFYDEGNRIRFTLDGTGQVFDYLPKLKKLSRVDKTIHSGFNFGAQQFIRKNILYSFGGTGFWSFSQALTYYDEKTAEWQLLRSKNPGPLSILNGYQGYSAKEDVFYSGGSEFYRFFEDINVGYTKELFAFDFKKNEWILLGNINSELPFEKLREISWTGEYFIHFANDKLYILDPDMNKVYQFHDSNKVMQSGYLDYTKGDTIYAFWNRDDGPVVKFSIKDMLSKSEYIGPFYSSNSKIGYYIFGSIILLLIVLTLMIVKKLGNRKSLFFEAIELTLIKALTTNDQPKFLSTNEINELLNLSDKSLENQRRIRINIINKINQKIAIYYNIEEAIERLSTDEDKRLISYRLKSEVMEKLKGHFKN